MIDALAYQASRWSLAPADAAADRISSARLFPLPSGAPLYVRFCAPLL
jgi:hypothetical protein